MVEQHFESWLKALEWVKAGDCVYVVSDMLDLAKVYREQGQKLELDVLVEMLQRLVGKEGTLLFPTFNWDFCKGVGFDYHKTSVRTGALSKVALRRTDFGRTTHPLYSFAVWGAHSKELMANHAVDSFGPGTIFEQMYQWNAKVLVIGLPPLQGVSYIHHVEQMVGVPYRYSKDFTANYTDAQGICKCRTYRMYVRDLDMDPRHIDGFAPLANQMQQEGMILTKYYVTVPCHFMRIADLHTAVRQDILENDSKNMYEYRHL